MGSIPLKWGHPKLPTIVVALIATVSQLLQQTPIEGFNIIYFRPYLHANLSLSNIPIVPY